MIGQNAPQGIVATNQIEAVGQGDALIGGPQFVRSYKCTEAAQDSLLEVVET